MDYTVKKTQWYKYLLTECQGEKHSGKRTDIRGGQQNSSHFLTS